MEPSVSRGALARSALTSIVLAVLSSACGGGSGSGDDGGKGGGGQVACNSITGGGSRVTSSGPVSNPGAAADGDLNSYATLNINTASQTASIRATAQSGIIFPSGSRAGAFVTFGNQQGSNATVVRTYLRGVMQETSTPANAIFDFAGSGTDANLYTGFTTSRQFDAVEFSETDNSAAPVYRVYEICSDGHG